MAKLFDESQSKNKSKREPDIEQTKPPTPKRKLWQTIHVGMGFLLLFSAYITTQNLLTSLFAAYGIYSLVVAYSCFTISSLFATFVVHLIGIRLAMIIASILYTLFIFLIQPKIPWVFLLGSSFVGIAAGPLWVSNGLYISQLTQDDKATVGKYNGIFNSMFIASQLIGNLLIGILFVTTADETGTVPESSRDITIWILGGFSCAGALILMFLRPVPKSIVPKETLKAKVLSVWRVLHKREMLVWTLYSFTTTGGSAFQFGQFPTLISLRFVPWVFAVGGAASIITSAVAGKLIDRFGCVKILILHIIILVLGYASLVLGALLNMEGIYFATGAFFLASDAMHITILSAMLMKDVPTQISGALSLNRLLGALGTVSLLVLALFLSWWQSAIVVCCLYAISFTILFSLRREPEISLDNEEPPADVESPESESVESGESPRSLSQSPSDSLS